MISNDYTEFILKEAKFVSGKGELCFSDVLDDFKKAQYIDILTYNISSKNDFLIDALRTVGNNDIPIRIITNIPNRWENYFGHDWKNKAKNNRYLYKET